LQNVHTKILENGTDAKIKRISDLEWLRALKKTGQNFQEKSLSKCGEWNEFDNNGCLSAGI
jgi:hypothetical protein